MSDDKARLLVGKAMQCVKDDLTNNAEVLHFTVHMVMTMHKFLRISLGDAAVYGLLQEELEELKTPLTPEDYPPSHPKASHE